MEQITGAEKDYFNYQSLMHMMNPVERMYVLSGSDEAFIRDLPKHRPELLKYVKDKNMATATGTAINIENKSAYGKSIETAYNPSDANLTFFISLGFLTVPTAVINHLLV